MNGWLYVKDFFKAPPCLVEDRKTQPSVYFVCEEGSVPWDHLRIIEAGLEALYNKQKQEEGQIYTEDKVL